MHTLFSDSRHAKSEYMFWRKTPYKKLKMGKEGISD